MKKHQNEESRKLFRAETIAPLFARPLQGSISDYRGNRLRAGGFDEFLKRSLVKKINISLEALSFESDIPFAPGERLELRMMIEDFYDGIIDLCVEVLRIDVRKKNYCIVVKYLGMGSDVEDIIRQFVSEREKLTAKSSKKAV